MFFFHGIVGKGTDVLRFAATYGHPQHQTRHKCVVFWRMGEGWGEGLGNGTPLSSITQWSFTPAICRAGLFVTKRGSPTLEFTPLKCALKTIKWCYSHCQPLLHLKKKYNRVGRFTKLWNSKNNHSCWILLMLFIRHRTVKLATSLNFNRKKNQLQVLD